MATTKRPKPRKRKSSPKLFCPKNSLLKMILYPKSDLDKPMTRYSALKLDKKSIDEAQGGLEAMALSSKYNQFWRTCLIYDNQTGVFIKKILHNGKVTLA